MSVLQSAHHRWKASHIAREQTRRLRAVCTTSRKKRPALSAGFSSMGRSFRGGWSGASSAMAMVDPPARADAVQRARTLETPPAPELGGNGEEGLRGFGKRPFQLLLGADLRRHARHRLS